MKDLPFTLTYLFDGDQMDGARLVCATGSLDPIEHPSLRAYRRPGTIGRSLKPSPMAVRS